MRPGPLGSHFGSSASQINSGSQGAKKATKGAPLNTDYVIGDTDEIGVNW